MPGLTKSSVLGMLEVTVHVLVLIAPLFFSGILHGSDSLLKQVPLSTTEVDAKATNVTGFGLRDFSLIYNDTSEEEDIEFSDEQQDSFGSYYRAAHIMYHVLSGIMIFSFLMPFFCASINHWYHRYDGLLIKSKLAKSLANVYIPLIMVTLLLMVVPFVLLTRSPLCGPNYVELGFIEEADSIDESDNGYNHHTCNDLVGTYAIVHEEIQAKCEIGSTGVGFLVSTGVWTLVLLVQSIVLRGRGYQFELDYQLQLAKSESIFSVEMDKATLDDDDSNTTTSSNTVEKENF